MKTKLVGGVAALVLFVVISAMAQTTQHGADVVIATGTGFEIKRSQLDQIVAGIQSTAAAEHKPITPDTLKAIKSQMLKRIIQIQILLTMATETDTAIGKAKAESQLKTLLSKADSREEFERKLKARGMTLDGLRTSLTQDATALATLTRKLGVTVSDAEAKAYYDEHPQNSMSKDNKAEFERVDAEIKDFLSNQKACSALFRQIIQ
jgi:hypothetical protein